MVTATMAMEPAYAIQDGTGRCVMSLKHPIVGACVFTLFGACATKAHST